MSDPIRIVIVDDHHALRIGLSAMLAAFPQVLVVGEAADTAGAIEICQSLAPDVVLMDLRLPGGGGVEATLRICQSQPHTRILVVTTYEGDEDVHRAIQAGASGYLLKGLSSAELASAIETVHRGGRVIPEGLAARFKERNQRKDLSSRELQVLQQIVLGRSNKEIATSMGVGEESVKTYLKSLFQKLGVSDRTQAAIEAVRQGIVHL
jgi:DNA-binding NarL/FixJ family response regulator